MLQVRSSLGWKPLRPAGTSSGTSAFTLKAAQTLRGRLKPHSPTSLAHRISDKAEAAYRRGDQFDKRRKLMETWAAFC